MLFLISAIPASAQQVFDPSHSLVTKVYCEKNSDCAIRQGVCGDEPMNIYFDNANLIRAQADVRCLPPVRYTNPRCRNNQCVADKVQNTARAAPAADGVSKYLAGKLYCEKDSDCALREGSCTKEPMNIYFDTSELIASQAWTECLSGISYLNPRCEAGKCVADLVEASPPMVACTMEAKLCPGGSAVGRVGPNCEFAKCPGEE